MTQILAYMLFFLIGAIAGAATFMYYGLQQVRKMKKTKQTLIDEVKKKTRELEQKTNSIKERLIRAQQIAQTQMDLRAQAEMPSKNGLHSKYKNGLVTEITELEQEKINLLKTIITDGFNPMITIIQDDGTKEEIPLSDYIETAQQSADIVTGKKPETPPLDNAANEPRKIGKFFVYRGGRDDGTSH